MKHLPNLLILRIALIAILLMHSIPAMLDNGVNDFGKLYLNTIGFSPLGVPLAWAIKLSHVAAAISLILNRYVKVAGFVTIAILLAGIYFVHFPEGWFVVGGGRNGYEFNLLLIAAFLTVMYQKNYTSSKMK